jgi:2-polyprenyl-3-methyl-5-hydroxy-6-metoxy-1,4-benzoquinol methylase
MSFTKEKIKYYNNLLDLEICYILTDSDIIKYPGGILEAKNITILTSVGSVLDCKNQKERLSAFPHETLLVEIPDSDDRRRESIDALQHILLRNGYAKHPLYLNHHKYEQWEAPETIDFFLFRRLRQLQSTQYTLEWLAKERDLHMDMLRESGRRSDAHIARYQLAAEIIPTGSIILDAACGMGYGSEVLATVAKAKQVIGIDTSDNAIIYANTAFSDSLRAIRFEQRDVSDLDSMETEFFDAVVSFETLEHLENPTDFMRHVTRLLRPGGIFISSIPNRWVDNAGIDPNPWHKQVFDHASYYALLSKFLDVEQFYQQNAGGGMRSPEFPRVFRKRNLPILRCQDEAEWWVCICRKPSHVAQSRVKIKMGLATSAPLSPLYTSWCADKIFETVALSPADAAKAPNANLDILVSHEHYEPASQAGLYRALAQGIPTVVLPDGVLGFRNTWEHPQLMNGAIFNPVAGTAFASLSPSHADAIQQWNSRQCCVPVGFPPLDKYYGLRRRTTSQGARQRILIATAKTPYFTPDQRALVIKALFEISSYEKSLSTKIQSPEFKWRVTQDLPQVLQLNKASIDDRPHLSDVLQEVDAVITTYSTVILEAMMLGLPVALLDYGNEPQYVNCAWQIKAGDQIESIISQLLSPKNEYLDFQDWCLHQAVLCDSPAAPRMREVIFNLVQKRGSGPIEFRPDNPSLHWPGISANHRFSKFAPSYDQVQARIQILERYLLDHNEIKGEIARTEMRQSRITAQIFWDENGVFSEEKSTAVFFDSDQWQEIYLKGITGFIRFDPCAGPALIEISQIYVDDSHGEKHFDSQASGWANIHPQGTTIVVDRASSIRLFSFGHDPQLLINNISFQSKANIFCRLRVTPCLEHVLTQTT